MINYFYNAKKRPKYHMSITWIKICILILLKTLYYLPFLLKKMIAQSHGQVFLFFKITMKLLKLIFFCLIFIFILRF